MKITLHKKAEDDCCRVIDEQVYNVTTYLPQHPTPPQVIIPWCGRDATHAYHTKNLGRPHSAYASELLQQYRIGVLNEAMNP